MNLNGAHLHLVLNHLPVVGVIGATVLLGWALIARGSETRRVALAALLLAGLSAVPAYLTGDGAEDTIRHLPGVERHRIHEHEDAAKWGLALGLVSAVVAAGALITTRGKPVSRGLTGVAFTVALFSCLVFARVAMLGGEIRHPEIRGGFVAPPGSGRAGAPGGESGERGEHEGD